MTEYTDSVSVNRIIGAPAGYVGYDDNAELPFDALESNPYQIILLDEFEKAHRSVQRLFMRAFDEGTITTSRGSTIDFTKAIIIATTNASHSAGSSKQIGFGNASETKATDLSVIDQLKQFFDAELINRFTHIYTFNAISKDVYKSILLKHTQKKSRELLRNTHQSTHQPSLTMTHLMLLLTTRMFQTLVLVLPRKLFESTSKHTFKCFALHPNKGRLYLTHIGVLS